MIDTLEFADRFEQAGFDHEKARALAASFAVAHDAGREEVATKADLFLMENRLLKAIAELEVRTIRAIGDNGRELSGRFWTTMAVIVAVATAISATIGAATALLLRSGGLQ